MEGAWIRICCRIYHSGEMGALTKTLPEWSRVFGVDATNALRILTYLQNNKIADILPCLTGFLPSSDQKIKVISRRIRNEEKEKESNRIKSNKSYAKKKKEQAKGSVLPDSDQDFTGRVRYQSQKSELEEEKEIRIPVADAGEQKLLISQIQEWQRTFSFIDVYAEITGLVRWFSQNENKDKRWPKKQWFIAMTNWLAKQNKIAAANSDPNADPDDPTGKKAAQKRQRETEEMIAPMRQFVIKDLARQQAAAQKKKIAGI